MARLVLADPSPLIALAGLGGLRWLPVPFGTLVLPGSLRAGILDHRKK